MELSPESQIDPAEITFRWIHGFYSGVLCGFAEWQGQLCYFNCCDDTVDDEWKYSLHRLSAEDAEKAVRENEDFKKRWGNHNDLLPDGRHAGGVCTAILEESAAAGDEISSAMAAGTWQPPYSYSDHNPMVGWFISRTF